MSEPRPIIGILKDGSLDQFEPVASVDDVDPQDDGRPLPSFWMHSTLSPLEGKTIAGLYAELHKITLASQTMKWCIEFSDGLRVVFNGFIKHAKPELSDGIVRVEFRLNGQPRTIPKPD